ncbi:MAG: acyltransferase [Flavobacteriales bacterium]|nr:acyltransferase [Flavobacteriales bacterium]
MTNPPPSGTSTPGTKGRRWELVDMLRGIAVLLVLFRHHDVGGPLHDFGWMGVDLFFVLSGFLVSGLIFDEYRRTGEFRGLHFLIRRGFKIYPSFYALILVSAGAMLLTGRTDPIMNYVAGDLLLPELPRRSLGAYLVLGCGRALLFHLGDRRIVGDPAKSAFRSTRDDRHLHRALPILPRFAHGHVAGSTVRGPHPFLCDPSAHGFAVGRCAARGHPSVSARRLPALLSRASLGAHRSDRAVAAPNDPDSVRLLHHVHLRTYRNISGWCDRPWSGGHCRSLECSACLAKVVGAARGWVGAISYTTYLWHLFVLLVVELGSERLGFKGSEIEFVVFVALSVAAGFVTSILIERPFLHLRERWFPSRSRSVV